jgi:hypothetical protein
MVKKFENAHILLWLLKDMAWCMGWKTLGTLMIFPTFGVALFIIYFQRQHTSHLIHNIAVTCWISANSLWMLSEFWGLDEERVSNEIPSKAPALVFFLLGTGILLGYYVYRYWKRRR